MAESRKRVFWEQVSPVWWSSPVGYLTRDRRGWTAHVYRNQRCGVAWTEAKPGFQTVAAAMRWVENQSEE